MDVNISRERVGILCLQSTQPENARHDWIAARRIRRNDFTCAQSILEHRARRRIVADFFGDLHFTQWRKTAAAPIAQSEFRRRDWINCKDVAAIKKGEFLFARADDDLMLRVRRRAGCEESARSKR